ncbi:hypothetical protein [Luteimicrobium subarcticum]|uniref:Uncharacterized protein n=1 Tax=Luteimicrobium subarcticum TaxID=620910 RepID=A0A2M8WSI8_9MICO|nr:hypothetical protein [Luteimicrobium subarcticum]PJI93889.1 hypothetical protein CLV34_1369 [Luteimicrobium subarcticum]
MSAAAVGLVGVVVGAVLTTLWAWLALLRGELTDAMTAARLVDEDLHRRLSDLGSCAVDGVASAVWEQNRNALAKVLQVDSWRAVARVYRSPERRVDVDDLVLARAALARLVSGRRSVVPARYRFWDRPVPPRTSDPEKE